MRILKGTTAILSAVLATASYATSLDGLPTIGNGTGRGDLVLALVDNANTTSILWDLSDASGDSLGAFGDLTVMDIREWAAANPGGSFTITNSTISAFVAAHDSFRFNLFGVSNVQINGNAVDIGIATTVKQGAGSIPASTTGNVLQQAITNQAGPWLQDNIANGLAENGTLTAEPSDSWFYDSPPRHGDNIFTVDATVGGGVEIPFIYIRKQPGPVEDEFDFTTFETIRGANSLPVEALELGAWELASNGDLTFSAVPIPGLVWLFGAGAAALGLWRRRDS